LKRLLPSIAQKKFNPITRVTVFYFIAGISSDAGDGAWITSNRFWHKFAGKENPLLFPSMIIIAF